VESCGDWVDGRGHFKISFGQHTSLCCESRPRWFEGRLVFSSRLCDFLGGYVGALGHQVPATAIVIFSFYDMPALEVAARAAGVHRVATKNLSWCDVNFAAEEINLARSIVGHHIGNMKTEASKKPIPVAGELASALMVWSQQSPYNQLDDWIFASPHKNGKQPYWPETPLKCFVQPAAKLAGIKKTMGWHIFRRTFATLLKCSGEDVKTVQELMRHANSRMTLDLYAQAITSTKRAAHLKLVDLIKPGGIIQSVPLCSHDPMDVTVND
jgi:hypothetical protein